MTRVQYLRHSVSAIALACGAAFAAQAQPVEAPARPAPVEIAAADSTDETVLVTGTRRATDLQKTAISGTVLNADTLAKKSVIGLTALQYAAPSVTITDYGSANVFNIRGVGRERVDVEIPSGIVIYRDGVPTLAGYFQNEPYYDMASIEVLRGPQGTIAGKSASGGAVFIRTKNPDLNGTSGFAQIGGANHGQFEFTGALNVNLTDTLAMRVAFDHLNRQSWYDLTGPYTGSPGERDLDSARISFLWQPVEDLEIVWKTDLNDLDFGGNVTSSYGTPLFDVHQDAPFRYTDKSIRSVLDIKYKFDNGITLNSLSGAQSVHTINNLDLNGAIVTPSYWFQSQGNFYFYSQEFNLVSPDDQAFRWVVGVFAQRQLSRIPSYVETGKHGFTFTGGPFFPNMQYPWLTTPWRMEEDDLAIFGNVEYDITPEFTIEGGLRYSYNHRDQFTEVTFGFGNIPPTIPFAPPTQQTLSDTYVDGKIAVNWQPDENNFIYALFSAGHTTSSFNIFPPNNEYDPMFVNNYEIGWKGTFMDGQVRTQVNAFYETLKDYQAVFGVVIPGGPTNLPETRNAEDDSTIWGLEASAQMNFGDFSIDIGAAYLDSKLGTFSNVINPFATFVVPDGTPLPANCSPGQATVNLTGAKAPFSPSFTGNIGVQYRFEVMDGITLTPRADFAHIGENRATLFECEVTVLKARDLLNLQLRLEGDDGGWYANLWMTNATDEEYVGGIQNDGALFYAGAPRQFGIRVGKRF
jgi:iron complex outermembrane receptor protein